MSALDNRWHRWTNRGQIGAMHYMRDATGAFVMVWFGGEHCWRWAEATFTGGCLAPAPKGKQGVQRTAKEAKLAAADHLSRVGA